MVFLVFGCPGYSFVVTSCLLAVTCCLLAVRCHRPSRAFSPLVVFMCFGIADLSRVLDVSMSQR
jgi:hypothetical protein